MFPLCCTISITADEEHYCILVSFNVHFKFQFNITPYFPNKTQFISNTKGKSLLGPVKNICSQTKSKTPLMALHFSSCCVYKQRHDYRNCRHTKCYSGVVWAGASHLDKSSVMFSSLIPPNTLNFLRLHTWVFSYFPKVMLWTIAGLSNFKIKNWWKRETGTDETGWKQRTEL